MWTKRSTLRGERMTNEPTQPLPESVRKAITSEELARTLINYLVENDGEDSIEMMVAGIQCIYLDALAAPIQELLNAAEEATLSDIRKFFGDTCTMQEAPALRLFADYDIAHPYRKIGALARIIAEAESRGRDAGLEEATTAKIVTGRGETVLVPSYLKDAIRALKTSAAKREETQ